MKTEREKWDEFYQIIMESTDIKATAESWGLEFTGSVSDQGWAECRAVNREDKKPSAAVNMHTGFYKDLGGGPSYPFFHLGLQYGGYSSYTEVVDDLAKRAKVLSKKPKSARGKSFWEKLRHRKWDSLSVRGICRELKISEKTLLLTGASLSLTNADELVVCFPVYDPSKGFGAPQCGIVVKNAYGGKLTKYNGKNRQPDMLSNYSNGSGGAMNRHALTHLGQAVVIYKVEGVSDMLALQELIPEELRNTHLVVTNSDGCDANGTSSEMARLLAGKTVVIIHDRDEPGQFGVSSSRSGGAIRWEACLQREGCRVINLQLPYEMQPKKGKDLRDWITEGHTYEDLVELVRTTPVSHSKEKQIEDIGSNLTEHQAILRRLDIVVLGHTKTGHIQVFNARECRKFSIPDINRFTYEKQLMHIGETAAEHIANPYEQDSQDDGLIHTNDVRVAISHEAGGKEISRTNAIGVGLWESGGRLFAVGAGEWIAVNGGISIYQSPMIDDKIVDFGESEETWYNKELLLDYLEDAVHAEWREDHLHELAEIFGRWDNHQHPNAGMSLACLAIACWAQSVWDWRPWVAITGESSSGKTLLMNFLSQYFGRLCISTSDASEAGIRNTIGTSARILLYDEFEQSAHRAPILKMLMSSSRKGGFGTSLRSNAAQGSVQTSYQLIPWFGAVELLADSQTMINRYITFELGSRKGMSWFALPESDEEFDRLRNKSIAVILRCWKRALELTKEIARAVDKEYFRQGESYALISAVYAAICGHSTEQAIKAHKDLIEGLRGDLVINEEDAEHELVMNAILSSQIRMGGGRTFTVGQVLQAITPSDLGGNHPDEILESHGIRKIPRLDIVRTSPWKHAHKRGKGDAKNESYVYFNLSAQGAVRRVLLKGTEYEKANLNSFMSRLDGAFKGQCKVGGSNSQGVYVPASLLNSAESVQLPGSVEWDGPDEIEV